MWSYQVINLITKWNPVRGLPHWYLLCSYDHFFNGDDRSDSEGVPRSPFALLSPVIFFSFLFSRCRMWHVSGVIFVKCYHFVCFFVLIFPAILHSMCIYCVSFSIHIGYFPVYVWLLVMYHWLSVPNNGKSALFALRPVYACTSHVQQPLYCFWCVSSFVTVTETGYLRPFRKSTSGGNVNNQLSYYLNTKIWENKFA